MAKPVQERLTWDGRCTTSIVEFQSTELQTRILAEQSRAAAQQ